MHECLHRESLSSQLPDLLDIYNCLRKPEVSAKIDISRARNTWPTEFTTQKPSPNTLRALAELQYRLAAAQNGLSDRPPTVEHLERCGFRLQDFGCYSEYTKGDPSKAEVVLVLSHTGVRLSSLFMHTVDLRAAQKLGFDDLDSAAAILELERDRGLDSSITFMMDIVRRLGLENVLIFVSEMNRGFSDINRIVPRMSTNGGVTFGMSVDTVMNQQRDGEGILNGGVEQFMGVGSLSEGSLQKLQTAAHLYDGSQAEQYLAGLPKYAALAKAHHRQLQHTTQNALLARINAALGSLKGIIIPHSMDAIPGRPQTSLLSGNSKDMYYYAKPQQMMEIIFGFLEAYRLHNSLPTGAPHDALIREAMQYFEEQGVYKNASNPLGLTNPQKYPLLANIFGIDHPYKGRGWLSQLTNIIRLSVPEMVPVIVYELRKDILKKENRGYDFNYLFLQQMVERIYILAEGQSAAKSRQLLLENQMRLATHGN